MKGGRQLKCLEYAACLSFVLTRQTTIVGRAEVFCAAEEQIMKNLGGMDVSHVCNVVWSYARA